MNRLAHLVTILMILSVASCGSKPNGPGERPEPSVFRIEPRIARENEQRDRYQAGIGSKGQLVFTRGNCVVVPDPFKPDRNIDVEIHVKDRRGYATHWMEIMEWQDTPGGKTTSWEARERINTSPRDYDKTKDPFYTDCLANLTGLPDRLVALLEPIH